MHQLAFAAGQDKQLKNRVCFKVPGIDMDEVLDGVQDDKDWV